MATQLVEHGIKDPIPVPEGRQQIALAQSRSYVAAGRDLPALPGLSLMTAAGGVSFHRLVAANDQDAISSEGLKKTIAQQLKSKLHEKGLSDAEADSAARSFIGAVSPRLASTFGLTSQKVRKDTLDLITTAILAGLTPRIALHLAASPKSPSGPARAHDGGDEELSPWEIARRAKLAELVEPAGGRREGETAYAYYERAWGPARDAGILYRDDLARMGEPSLLKTVIQYCDRHWLDKKAILPKKVADRVQDELRETPPKSDRAQVLRTRLRIRASVAKATGKLSM